MRQATVRNIPPLDYSGVEALNTICTNLSFSGRDVRKIIFTSSTMSEGKSFMCMHILENLARRGRRVVLVEADLRRPFIIKRYDVEIQDEILGLAHYLAGQCNLDDALYTTNLYGACIIPAGRELVNPISLLDSPYFSAMLDELADNFDMVIVDAPPVGMVIDAAIIAKSCDGVVLVAEYNKTRRRELLPCKKQMESSGCPILGCIINKVSFDSISAKKYYNKTYYSHYNSGYYTKSAKDAKEK